MSNPILTSNQSSAIVATINESGGLRMPHVYSEENKLVPPHAMQILPVQAQGTVAASRSVTFEIPKVGFLQGVWLNLTMGVPNGTGAAERATDAQTDTVADAVILDTGDAVGFHANGLYQCIREIRAETSGRTIEALDTASILARISDLPYGKRRACEHAARMAGDPDSYTAAYNACIWVPFWFNSSSPGGGDPKYSYLTTFNEPLRITLSFSNCKCLYSSNSSDDFFAHAPTAAELLCRYNILDDKTLDMVVQENQGSGMMSQLITVMKPESDYASTSESSGTETTATVDLKENDAVTAIYLSVERNGAAAASTYAGALKTQANLEIRNVQLKFNNTSVFDVPGTWLQHFGRISEEGDGTDAAGPSGLRYVYKLDFGLLPGMGLTSNCVALREISSPQLVVTYAHNGTSTAHTIKVRYATKSFLTVASNSGRVALSISS